MGAPASATERVISEISTRIIQTNRLPISWFQQFRFATKEEFERGTILGRVNGRYLRLPELREEMVNPTAIHVLIDIGQHEWPRRTTIVKASTIPANSQLNRPQSFTCSMWFCRKYGECINPESTDAGEPVIRHIYLPPVHYHQILEGCKDVMIGGRW